MPWHEAYCWHSVPRASLASQPTSQPAIWDFCSFALQNRQLLIRRAFAQGVSDREKCAFDIGPFHFFEFRLKHLLLKPTQAAISEQFLGTTAMDARRRLWEPPDTTVVSCFHVGGALFLKRFSEQLFFCKIMPNGPQMASKI